MRLAHCGTRRGLRAILALSAAALASGGAQATVTVTDDAGHKLSLAAPAHRIVSLAPHATELLYAAGAGAFVVGVSQYSDYPPPARQVASVGGVAALDLERLIALKPDLVVAWGSGNSASQVARLRQLGIPVFESEPRDFATVATSLERLAQLAGTDTIGGAAAAAFRARRAALAARYRRRPTVRVFYQIWNKPLMTLNDRTLAAAALRLCGAQNIFGQLPQLVPSVSREAVLAADPEAIVSADAPGQADFSDWKRLPQMTAVTRNNLFSVDANLLTRGGPRILDGTEALCRQLELARSRR